MKDEIGLTQHKELLSNTSNAHEAHPLDELWSSSKGLATVAAVGTAMVAAPLMLRRGAGVDRLVAGADTAAARNLGNDVLTGTAMRMKPVSIADKLAALQAPTTRITEAEHRAALRRVGDAITHKPGAETVLDNFARVEAKQFGVDVKGMSTTGVLSELSELSAGNLGPERLAEKIVGYAQRGQFKDVDLANRRVAEMLTKMGNQGKHMPEAIGVATNHFGADMSHRNPGIVYSLQELISNGAIVKSIDMAEARAAVLLSHARHEGLSTMRGAAWSDLRITPETVGIVRSSPNFSVADQQLKPAVVDKVLSALWAN